MSRSHKKPAAPAPAVVSTGCSGLMSCLSLHRRVPLTRSGGDEAPAPLRLSDAAAEQYWKRMQLLEEEIRRLGKWLAQDQDDKTNKTAAAATTGSNTAEAAAYRDQESSSGGGTDTTTTKRCVSVWHGAAASAGRGVQEMAKLEDGSYLHEIGRVGRPWGRLAVQVSRPVVPADAASASEVLDKMVMTKAEDLWKFLVKMMPMKDVAGRRDRAGETVVRKIARLSSGTDLLDAVLFNAMDKMEGLVLEGLKIQMSSTTATDFAAATATAGADHKRDDAASKEDSMVHVVLLQLRDPEEGYGAIGEPMIGLLEASTTALGRKDGTVKVEVQVQVLHVAGISRNRGDDGRGLMWSASLRECRGSSDGGGGDGDGDGDGCRCRYVRNPNRVFQR